MQLTASRKETSDLKVVNRKLSEQNSKFRSIILQGISDDSEVPDDKIHVQFVELRDIVERIVRRHYAFQGLPKLASHNNPWFEEQKRFRDSLKSLGSETLQQFYMRGQIFDFVNSGLIEARSFGIGDLENELKDFEKAVDRCRTVSPADLAEWRSRTIECGASLGERSRWPGRTCRDILDFMEPYVCGSAASNEQLGKTMRELCDKAYSLSLLMRRYKKATFQTSIMKDDTMVTAPVEAK
ncbi:MAG: hypothetical protein Q9226_009214, partial [Calogaya cf. arnoldii]